MSFSSPQKAHEYYLQNKEHILERQKAYFQRNKAARNEYQKAYAKKNPDKVNRYSRIQYYRRIETAAQQRYDEALANFNDAKKWLSDEAAKLIEIRSRAKLVAHAAD